MHTQRIVIIRLCNGLHTKRKREEKNHYDRGSPLTSKQARAEKRRDERRKRTAAKEEKTTTGAQLSFYTPCNAFIESEGWFNFSSDDFLLDCRMNTKRLVPPCLPSASLNRRRNRPTAPSTSPVAPLCSASATTVGPTSHGSNKTELTPCNLLNIISDARFRPIFHAIEEIKGRKCRPDFERILKCIAKQSSESDRSYERHEILLILDELLKLGLVTKVFHKGGFTIRIKNEKYAKLIEKMNICSNQKTPTTTPISPRQALAMAVTIGVTRGNTQPWAGSKDCVMNSNEVEINEHPSWCEIPSPALAVSKTGRKWTSFSSSFLSFIHSFQYTWCSNLSRWHH